MTLWRALPGSKAPWPVLPNHKFSARSSKVVGENSEKHMMVIPVLILPRIQEVLWPNFRPLGNTAYQAIEFSSASTCKWSIQTPPRAKENHQQASPVSWDYPFKTVCPFLLFRFNFWIFFKILLFSLVFCALFCFDAHYVNFCIVLQNK
jgi:hypothetical protein